jgi:anti-sigma B factor antagonist
MDDELELACTRPAPDVLVAHVTGELDFLTTPRLEKYLHERTTTNGTRHVVLELSGVTYLGSTGASLLVALARDPTILSAELHLTGVRGQARVQRPLDLMALTKIFDIHDDVEHFLAAAPPDRGRPRRRQLNDNQESCVNARVRTAMSSVTISFPTSLDMTVAHTASACPANIAARSRSKPASNEE